MSTDTNNSFFSKNRLKFNEMVEDTRNFLGAYYKTFYQTFEPSSPFGQLLTVIIHLGRMIFYYIEDSITELNIKTATRIDSVRGLATLTGHNPSRAISARGTLRLKYKGNLANQDGYISIPNFTTISSSENLDYVIVLPTEEVRISINQQESYHDVNVMQGKLEHQQMTGTGTPLQSFNVKPKKGASIDNFYVNVFVDGKKWELKESLLDMPFLGQVCMVKTGQTGGIDVFFGNGFNGEIPSLGATILIEYLTTSGPNGNINDGDSITWTIKDKGYLNNNQVDLNQYIGIEMKGTISFGTTDEPIYVTRMVAPKTSRSYTLINSENYKTFLTSMNRFSVIDAFSGNNTYMDVESKKKINETDVEINDLSEQINAINLKTSGEITQDEKVLREILTSRLESAEKLRGVYEQIMMLNKLDDNVVYLFLVPDVMYKMSSGLNYWNVLETSFYLTQEEEDGVYAYIEESGRRGLTVDNKIIQPQVARFAVNVVVTMWAGFNKESVVSDIRSSLSQYFIKFNRRDIVPVSDIIAIVEAVSGVDTVTVNFVPDNNNSSVYQGNQVVYNLSDGEDLSGWGLDQYGNIDLTRTINNALGTNVYAKDVLPLFRGHFKGVDGIEYNDVTKVKAGQKAVCNVEVRGVTDTKNASKFKFNKNR